VDRDVDAGHVLLDVTLEVTSCDALVCQQVRDICPPCPLAAGRSQGFLSNLLLDVRVCSHLAYPAPVKDQVEDNGRTRGLVELLLLHHQRGPVLVQLHESEVVLVVPPLFQFDEGQQIIEN